MYKILVSIFLFILTSVSIAQQIKPNWATQFGGTGWDVVTDMAEKNNGKIILAGSFYDTIINKSDTLVSKGSRDILLLSYNKDGSLNNTYTFGGVGYEYVKNIEASGESDLIISLSFNQEFDINVYQLRETFKIIV